jgi:hypothetical protein
VSAAKLHTREDSGLRLDRDLTWWHDGERIEHPNIIEAFNRGVQVDSNGRLMLVFGGDWCFITAEDCAYGINAVDQAGGALSLRLSDRTAERLDPATLALSPDGALFARVKHGLAKARFSRAAHFELAQRLTLSERTVLLDVGEGTLVATSLPPEALEAP